MKESKEYLGEVMSSENSFPRARFKAVFGSKEFCRKSGGKKQRKGRWEERLEQRKTPIPFLQNTVPSSKFHRK
jgi:hypothetical protein